MREKLIEYCDAKPVGIFLLRLLATVLSLIALIAAIIAVVQELPVTTYVDSDEAPFGSYWRIPVCTGWIHSRIELTSLDLACVHLEPLSAPLPLHTWETISRCAMACPDGNMRIHASDHLNISVPGFKSTA